MPEKCTTSKRFLFGPKQYPYILDAVLGQPRHRCDGAHWEINLKTHKRTTSTEPYGTTDATGPDSSQAIQYMAAEITGIHQFK